MRAEFRVPGPRDARIAAVAARQRGRVCRRQLHAVGISNDVIAARVKRGLLHDLGGGVFAAGHGGSVRLGDETAALLAAGPGAVLSHQSAAALWGIGASAAQIHVLVPNGARSRAHDARLHRTRNLGPADVRIRDGLPVTAPARTLLDLAACLSPRQLELALDRAIVARIVRVDELRELLARSPSRTGRGVLRSLVGDDRQTTLTRSEAEELFLRLVREAKLPAPQVNQRHAGYEVDFAWPAHRLIVEIDGYRFHSTRRAFEHDHRKDVALRNAGFTVLRFTYDQLRREPLAVIAALSAQVATISAPSSREMATSTE